jgi:hypothetical protein
MRSLPRCLTLGRSATIPHTSGLYRLRPPRAHFTFDLLDRLKVPVTDVDKQYSRTIKPAHRITRT